ncbi:DNA adenine methylase [Celeribacter sp.]|uniref:DNA adenine methylase n=1 Tax=Celeribacter sp. TaxID=1890673 RepID=UPI003A939994
MNKLKPYVKSTDYVKSPFRYPGGKFYALKHIIPFLNVVEHSEYREPFVGGGSVFFGKKKADRNWINDIDNDLMNVYSHILNKSSIKDFSVLFDDEYANRERHKEIIQMNAKSSFERAFQTYYLNRTSYSGIINKPAWGYKDGKSSPPKNWKNFLLNAHIKLQNTKITSLDFEEVINAKSKDDKVLIYLDPPYYLADQKRAYTNSFVLKDHKRLADILKNTKFKFCLSYDDCEEIRVLYKWANIYTKSWLYNTANINGASRTMGNELIITNYTVEV